MEDVDKKRIAKFLAEELSDFVYDLEDDGEKFHYKRFNKLDLYDLIKESLDNMPD